MAPPQRLLQFYITSAEYFTDIVTWFWEFNDECGVCGPQKLPFESNLCRECRKREMREGRYYLTLKDSLIRKYFSEIENKDVLFAVIFAHWLKLPPKQISRIRRCRRGHTAWQHLIEYITSPDDIYFITIGDKEIPAKKRGVMLIALDGTQYEIN